eukprot:CAMPEP_0174373230 /NCGR_PEP_ID=MMETSP0811_2-20130205/106295_1 /TAXON_ID=73025 ORGANISM="Eutreptiella gymnastica-like, Strain CCMP1594" /NCGR_SAMPLE_ID=MMETSP0811_2 /ASSEMBLY_ACC=CAM_ASM_000667 /LENGTH=92 /DNA_ID=CAMNT_0015521333 /DNA_START=242 /DNA_END=518 /DNA_ORIENTATION=-
MPLPPPAALLPAGVVPCADGLAEGFQHDRTASGGLMQRSSTMGPSRPEPMVLAAVERKPPAARDLYTDAQLHSSPSLLQHGQYDMQEAGRDA